jgi:hypothetical protein
VAVPAYCTSRQGKVFRVFRSSELVAHGQDAPVEVACEFDTTLVRDKIALGQAIPTPEETFEQLWQQLRLDLDVGYS